MALIWETKKWSLQIWNVGILYTFGIVSLGVYGIVLAGYAANSKYPFLGGIRSSAQMVSYEIAMGMSVVPIFLIVGSLNLGHVVEYQTGSIFHWLIFKQPIAFIIFVAAMFAETNRLPFDLPESEQELAGGYNVEYSSMKFALFFMGEYAAMTAASAMMVTLFFGGWSLPFAGLDQPAASGDLTRGLLHIAIFLGKTLCVEFLIIWVRWMWPALSLRSTHGPRLASFYSTGPGKYRDYGRDTRGCKS